MLVIERSVPLACQGMNLFARLRYSTADPLAVACDFGAQGVWVFARDLLQDGIASGQAGIGDVRVDATGNLFRLHLGDHHVGAVTLVGPQLPVRRFLLRTYMEVPRGDEVEFLDFSHTNLSAG